jgi:hypothetical protein
VDAQLNRKSLAFGVPGIILQLAGNFMARAEAFGLSSPGSGGPPGGAGLWLVVSVLGTILLIYGLCLYAKSKGYHPAFGLLGLLSILGIIILAVLPDKLKAA